MSYLVDTNILIYSSAEDSEFFSRAGDFIKKCRLEAETWCITWVNIFEYLRVITHPGIFKIPMTASKAEENIAAFLSLPNIELLEEKNGFFEIYREISAEAGIVSGNLVHDAHIAALMKAHGVKKIYTLDAQFRIFSFLEVIIPFKTIK